MTRPLRLGVIGLSPGNGHPYSWSAIFNGYEPGAMAKCGFPAIPAYLSKQKFPEDAISGASVTHVWAQDRETAKQVAQAARIENVVEEFTDMLGEVDGLLLARDDARSHFGFASPFLDAGIPVYIDKPLALSVSEAHRLFERQQYDGQIFSCSALRYAPELQLADAERRRLGRLHQIQAVTPHSWDKYAVHVIEPTLRILGHQQDFATVSSWSREGATTVTFRSADGVDFTVSTLGSAAAPIGLRLFGSDGWTDLLFKDAFTAFKAALCEFVEAIHHRRPRIDPDFTTQVVRLIEAGRAS